MKKMNVMIVGISAMVMLMVGCEKDSESVDYSVIDIEKAKIENALELSQAFHDTLKMVYDTAIVHKNNPYCIKYDTLFHQSDSMFRVHYALFGDEMYKNGMMMGDYSPTNGMMQGGMMNSSMMDMNRLMADTTMVNGYHRNMKQMRTKHQPYHDSIYN